MAWVMANSSNASGRAVGRFAFFFLAFANRKPKGMPSWIVA